MRTGICILIFATIFIFSCSSQKYPGTHSIYHGVFVGCNIDSTSFVNDKLLRISSSKRKINFDCPNKPNFYITFPVDWSMNIILWFKDNEFAYGYNPRETKGGIGFSIDGGKLKYSKKAQILTLTSNKFGWTKVFKTEYFKIDSTLILTEIKNGY